MQLWTGHHYFWIDLAITPGLTMLIVAVASRSAPWLTRLLASRPLHRLGRISYSLYLIHLPILTVLAKKVAPHYAEKGPHTWVFVVVVGVPVSLVVAWLFAQVFELPFQRHRSWDALLATARDHLAGARARLAGVRDRLAGRAKVPQVAGPAEPERPAAAQPAPARQERAPVA